MVLVSLPPWTTVNVSVICCLPFFQCCPEAVRSSDERAGERLHSTLHLWLWAVEQSEILFVPLDVCFASILNQILFFSFCYSRIWAMDSEWDNLRHVGSLMKSDRSRLSYLLLWFESCIYVRGITDEF